MPCLNSDLLFDIGKEFVKNGNFDAIIQFAVSGRECLKAIKNVFASVTTLKLDVFSYHFSWDDKCKCLISFYMFGKIQCKFSIQCFGNSVKHLYLNGYNEAYEPIIDKIIAKKKLNSLNVSDTFFNASFLNEFLPSISSSLKYLSIPNKFMNETIRDSLNLDSLTITGKDISGAFCCKTVALEFSKESGRTFYNFNKICSEIGTCNSHISSIKQLIINRDNHDILHRLDFDQLKQYFPALEIFKINLNSTLKKNIFQHKTFIKMIINYVIGVIKKSKNVPSKIVLSHIHFYEAMNIDNRWETIFENFELDKSFTDYLCFRKTVQSAGTQSVTLEIQMAK